MEMYIIKSYGTIKSTGKNMKFKTWETEGRKFFRNVCVDTRRSGAGL
jgi:hypothetical protein